MSELNILGLPYTVITHKKKKDCPKDMRDAYGFLHYASRTIYLNPWAQKHEDDRVDATLLHEILHAIDYITTDEDSRLSEGDIWRLAHGLESLVREGNLKIEW